MECVVVGLGNPGIEYENSRHNIGFYFVEALALHWGASDSSWREKWHGFYCTLSHKGHKIHCVKPQTYMNRSGESVVAYCNFFKIPLENVVIIHDDLDMAPARIKFVNGGGNGGHNGIKSLVNCLNGGAFYRLKIGIGRPGKGGVHPDFPVEKYVLSHCSKEDYALFNARKEPIYKGFDYFFAGEIARAIGVFNSLKG